MSQNEVAFFIGLFGSLHCIGMCGPLAFAIPAPRNQLWLLLADKLLYNAGRVFSYSILGLLAGLLGRQLWVAGLQQGISIASGVLIIAAALSRILKLKMLLSNQAGSALLQPVSHLINYALQHRAGHLVIGMLNGWLPCGFVYLALIGAINTASPAGAAEFMFCFGMGTFPLMLLATLSTALIGPAVRRRINVALPYLMLCLGCWFILRGLNMNIPYLSPPPVSASPTVVCH